MTNKLTQPQRLVVAMAEILVLLLIHRIAFESWIPGTDVKALWLFSAMLNVILASRLVTPFYEKPVDNIVYSVTALVVILVAANGKTISTPAAVAAWVSVAVLGVALIAAVFAIVFINLANGTWSQALRLISDRLGNARVAFSFVILFSVFAFHSASPGEVVAIAIAWAATVVFKPFDNVLELIVRVRRLFYRTVDVEHFGRVRGYQTPGIVLIQQERIGGVSTGQLVAINDHIMGLRVAVFLDYVGREEMLLARALEIDRPLVNEWIRRVLSRQKEEVALLINEDDVGDAGNHAIKNMIGIVAQDSSLDKLLFEIIGVPEIEEGNLVEVDVGNQKVIYQIINGLTKEEVVFQKNTFGFCRAEARKIGVWDDQGGRFLPAKWLPNLNAPVRMLLPTGEQSKEDAVGVFPGTGLAVRIRSLKELVSHNTAILGILGIGKSSLAFELVERMLVDGVKVICLDLTDEYAEELAPFCYDKNADALYKAIEAATGSGGKELVSKHVEEGGNRKKFVGAVEEYVKEFICRDTERRLLVFNPAQYEVWRQDSKPFQNEASMASLTPTEITQIFTEAALKACQKLGKVAPGEARVCVVYEEAHSLVPEWNTVVNEGDKAAVNGTSRAILQGRKFGLGCLLITQRTANVTKTILNQCNTIFAMRTFDATGTEFLSNYIGKSYAGILSSISERHAVFFGKASSCENPVLIRLNNRDAFLEAFREAHPVPKQKSMDGGDSKGARIGVPDFDDDIPF